MAGSRILSRYWGLDIPAGVTPYFGNNKYGRSTNVDDGVDTDIWDGANATDDIDLWVAPTAARVHNIASSSANDTSAGTGARTIRIWGLQTWSSEESSEDITMNGTSNVATSNSYVIIHRMKVLTCGSSGPNVGQIEATAVTDATITAIIIAGKGQTFMAVYGVPDTQDLYIPCLSFSVLRANLGTGERHIDMRLLANEFPDDQTDVYIEKESWGCGTRGSNPTHIPFDPFYKIEGPCIVKMQAAASDNNCDVSASFGIILRDK